MGDERVLRFCVWSYFDRTNADLLWGDIGEWRDLGGVIGPAFSTCCRCVGGVPRPVTALLTYLGVKFMATRHDDKYRLPAGADPVAWLTERTKTLEEEENRREQASEITDLVKRYPHVHSVLMAGALHEGVDRGAAINVWEQDGKLTACLTLRWLGRKCFYTAETWEGLWEGLERAIGDPGTVWRSDDGKRVTAGRKGSSQAARKGRT